MEKPKEILALQKFYKINLKLGNEIKEIIKLENKNTYYLNEKQEIIGLNLFRNQITDIKPLLGLTALTTLDLTNNQIADIRPLERLTALTWLDLSVNLITNIKALERLTALTTLDLYNNQIIDIKPLERLTALTTLNLSNNQITDIKPLERLTVLTELHLYGNQVTNIKPLEGLSALTELLLSNNQITDIKPLERLTAFTTLDLYNNQIIDIKPLERLTALTTLNLSNNQITDIKPLEGLTALTELRLSNNQITDIKPLKGLTALTMLYLYDNQITDIKPLEELTALNRLNLGNNLLFDLSPLYFILKNNLIKKISLESNQLLQFPPYDIALKGIKEIKHWFNDNLAIANELINENFLSKNPSLNLGKLGLTDISMLPKLFECTHLETLILSNHYAEYNYNENEWEKIEVKNEIYPNNIYTIPKEIERLKNLKILIVGGDWKKGETWNRFRIKDISNLYNLPNLEVLNISNNEVEEIRDLKKLKKLKILHANNNKIQNINELSIFPTLQHLFLSNNKLQEVNFLKDLANIETIDLHNNSIKSLLPIMDIINRIGISHSKWRINTINIENNPLDEILLNIGKYDKEDEKKLQLKYYFERLGFGTKKIKRTKIIFLGNTSAGKTTLSDILTGGNKAQTGGSTHGLNFINYEIQDENDSNMIIKGFDFGGQDYYHNLYHTFLDKSSLYFLVWGNGQENECYTNSDDEILFPLKYWLTLNNQETFNIYENEPYSIVNESDIMSSEDIELINEVFDLEKLDRSELRESMKNFKYNSENICDYYLIQNIKQGEEKKYLNEKELKTEYPFITDFKNFQLYDSQTEGREKIRKWILETAKENCIENEIQLIDFNVKKEFETIENQHKVVITFEDVKNFKIENLNQIEDANLDALLKGLHSILGCYYFITENYSENKIIVNIELFTDWIYKILNKEKLLGVGYFTDNDVKKWLIDEIASENIDFILAFMIREKLIFKMHNSDDRYFAPSYLPIIKSKTDKLFLKTFQKPIVKYKFESYFHTSILSDIISTFYDKLVINDSDNEKWQYVLWKNKVILFDDISNDQEKLILIEFHLPVIEEHNVKIPYISISKYSSNNNIKLVKEVMEHIEAESEHWSKEILATNGNYVPYDEIIKNINDSEGKISNLFTFNNQIYKQSDFKLFLPEKNQIPYPMKKVVISYSKEDLKLVHKFKDYLVPLYDDGLIEDPWYCTDLIAGDTWDDTIKQKFEDADIIFFMVSENLMKTKYVTEIEIKKAIDRWKNNDSVKIVPIILEYYHWQREGEYNLGQFSALPYMGKPILDFNRPKMAWFTVVEAIKVMIKKDLGSTSDALSKTVKQIYERIVEGKVDDNSN